MFTVQFCKIKTQEKETAYTARKRRRFVSNGEVGDIVGVMSIDLNGGGSGHGGVSGGGGGGGGGIAVIVVVVVGVRGGDVDA